MKVWDLRRSIKDTGNSIVQMDGPIGAMHIGDTYKGERPLIVCVSLPIISIFLASLVVHLLNLILLP